MLALTEGDLKRLDEIECFADFQGLFTKYQKWNPLMYGYVRHLCELAPPKDEEFARMAFYNRIQDGFKVSAQT